MIDPCHADTFQEAFEKNRSRLAHEKAMSEPLYEAMKREGDLHAEHMSPGFWEGCIFGNQQAHEIYMEELRLAQERAIERLKKATPSGREQFMTGQRSTLESWVDALKNNNPTPIVYW